MLIAAATKALDDASHAAGQILDNYYPNYHSRGLFKYLNGHPQLVVLSPFVEMSK